MQRRKFIGLAGSAMAAWPCASQAQQPQKSRRIAFVHSGIPAAKLIETGGTFWVRRFYEELRALGFSEGTNLVVERFSAEGSASRFAAVAAEVVRHNPEVIVVNHNALTKAFLSATTTIPIVAITTDPVSSGLVSNLARPGGNLTGVSVVAGSGIFAKRLQILKDVLPGATKVTYLQSSGVEAEASGHAVTGKLVTEATEAQIRRAFAEMTEQRVEAAIISDGGSFVAQRALLVELAAGHRLPTMYPYREYVELGGLMAYSPDQSELAKRMASDVHQILGGAKAGDIPYYQPTKWGLVINLKTAQTLGVTIPQALLNQADEVIE